MNKSTLALVCSATLLSVALFAAPANATIYTYNFDGTLSDSTGGGPDLVAHGGSLATAGQYTFGADQGLSLVLGGSAFNTYSIDIKFAFDSDVTAHGGAGYRRILDFLSGTSDNGLYSQNHNVDFYPEGYGGATPGGVLTNSVLADVIISKDATGKVTVTVGSNTFSFDDTSQNLANFTSSSTLNFFIDDNYIPGESTSGYVDKITITTNQIAAGVPEPSTWAMMILGFAGVGFAAYRRKNKMVFSAS